MADSTVHSKQPLAFEYGWPCHNVLFLWVLSGEWLSPSCKPASVPKTSTDMSEASWGPSPSHRGLLSSFDPAQKSRTILQARYWSNITKLLCDLKKIPKKEARLLHGALDRRTNPPPLLCLLQEPWASASLSHSSTSSPSSSLSHHATAWAIGCAKVLNPSIHRPEGLTVELERTFCGNLRLCPGLVNPEVWSPFGSHSRV